MTSDSQKKLPFSGTEAIADILSVLPEAAEILASYGLACAGCYVNAHESLRNGILGHGMGEDMVVRILEELNTAAEELGVSAGGGAAQGLLPTLTQHAEEKVLELQEEQGLLGTGLKVEVVPQPNEEPSYDLDFLESPEAGDRIIFSGQVKLFLSPESLNLLSGKKIDYLQTKTEEGFTIIDA